MKVSRFVFVQMAVAWDNITFLGSASSLEAENYEESSKRVYKRP